VIRSIERDFGAEFGSGAVFLDFDEVPGGEDWKDTVLEVLDDGPVVVTLITTRWNSRRGGVRRLHDPDDHVRFELEAALERGLPIIPVLYDPAHWPKAEQLPESVAPITQFQRVPFSDDRWDTDSARLIEAVHGALGDEPPPEEPGATSAGARPDSTPPTAAPSWLVRPPAGGLGTGHSPMTSGQYGVLGQQPPLLYRRAMFQETPEQRREREGKLAAERKRLKRAKEGATPFYARWAFWLASVITLVLEVAAIFGLEALLSAAAQRWTPRV
jgi:hypothetical protein